MRAWARHDGCPEEPVTAEIPHDANDCLTIKRTCYGPGRAGTEVALYVIEGGGHTWPGQRPIGAFLGKSALDLKANDLIWAFFQKHPMP